MDLKPIRLFKSSSPVKVRGANGQIVLAIDHNREYLKCKKEIVNVTNHTLAIYNENSDEPFAVLEPHSNTEIVCNGEWYSLGEPHTSYSPMLSHIPTSSTALECKPSHHKKPHCKPKDECITNEQLCFIIDAVRGGQCCGLSPEQLAIILEAIKQLIPCNPLPQVVTYDIPGTYQLSITGGSYVVLTVTLVGGGGGGAGASRTGTGGGGGGSGWKETSLIKLPTPVNLSIIVGIAGLGGIVNGNGTPGGATELRNGTITLCYAAPGQGGLAKGDGGDGGAFGGGSSGSSSVVGIGILGNGLNSINLGGGGGGGYSPGLPALSANKYLACGGGGGSSPYTGKGGDAAQITGTPTAAQAGTVGGGGGGGSFLDSASDLTFPGGNGGPGYAIIEYEVF